MEQSEIRIIDFKLWRPSNPHDRFCRMTAFHPLYASYFLKSYSDSVLREVVDLDHLQEAPTTRLSDELKEVLMDASLTTRLLDTNSMSEVLFHLEHKSKPSRTVALQLLTEVALSLSFRWTLHNRPESGNFTPPIPLMVVVYNGSEDWSGEIWFQDMFPDLPKKLRQYVPQFRVFFINLRRFKYGHLPGKPETRAIVESLLRATDGTFIDHLPRVFQHVAEAGLGKPQRFGLLRSISTYSSWTEQASSEQITKAITTVFKGQEGIEMAEAIHKGIIQEGIEIGEAKGELKGKVNAILTLLRDKFNPIPDEIIGELYKRTDPTALDSLNVHAAHCKSLDEFAEALK
jgi:hypothetical protein